nr:hypothetical protein [Tanacetum cinerariifolium]
MIEIVMHTVKNDKVFHTEKTRMLRLVVEIDVVGMIADVVDKPEEWTILNRFKNYSFMLTRKESNLSSSNTIVEVPKELPKVSMVNSSFKKLKFHLASFDMVVKERTTATAVTEGTWGFEHIKACFRDEIVPFIKVLKDLFNLFDQFLIDELTEI